MSGADGSSLCLDIPINGINDLLEDLIKTTNVAAIKINNGGNTQQILSSAYAHIILRRLLRG